MNRHDVAIPGGGAALTTGERRLMLAILEDAMRTLLGHRYGSRHARLAAAGAWGRTTTTDVACTSATSLRSGASLEPALAGVRSTLAPLGAGSISVRLERDARWRP
jgi:hypothetical protein